VTVMTVMMVMVMVTVTVMLVMMMATMFRLSFTAHFKHRPSSQHKNQLFLSHITFYVCDE
jgi:hypothetical protein